MRINTVTSWKDVLPQDALDKAKALSAYIRKERQSGKTIYPSQKNMFRALQLTPPDKVKVVIVGQDPYHESGQACGLSFSVPDECKVPPSLRNIFKELHDDIGCDIPESGDLTKWANEGVLLLNTVLTVEDGKANSHSKLGWQEFTSSIIQACDSLSQPVVYLLWGGQARTFCANRNMNNPTKLAICSSHPSPLGAYSKGKTFPAFIGSKPFSQANNFLESMGVNPVDWTLC